jgi:uncharacterized membrane protein YgdD (TMEM256/DUF423 family)
MQRTWIALGALAGLSAVAIAALAAHGLHPASGNLVRSGAEMQVWHALALLACGLWAPRGGKLADGAGAAFAIGLVLFCGSVYSIALGATRTAPAAPIGGALLMLGWLLLGLSAVFRPSPK